MARPDWSTYWIAVVDVIASRGTCARGRSGALLVDPRQQIIASGYVGAPRGLEHCDDVGHLLRKVQYEDGSVHEHCVRTAHAERNAIVQAARRGAAVEGATLYCTMEPCSYCVVDIINAGIVRVVAKHRYHGAELSRSWLQTAGIPLEVLNDTMPEYR